MSEQALSKLVVDETGLTFNPAQRQKIADDSVRMYHHGNLREWQGILLKAASIWNIHQHRAHGETSFDDFVADLGMNRATAYRYISIGTRMFQTLIERKPQIDTERFVFTQKEISGAFKGYFTNGHAITMRGLRESTKSLEVFQAYMRGDQVSQETANALLEQNNIVSEEHAEKAAEREQQRELTDSEATKAFHQNREREAEAHGLKWVRKEWRFVNRDGSPLREEQVAEMTMPDDAIRPWREFYKVVSSTKKRIYDAIRPQARQYALYKEHVHNTAFINQITDINRDVQTQLDLLSEMQECLLASDFERMAELVRDQD